MVSVPRITACALTLLCSASVLAAPPVIEITNTPASVQSAPVQAVGGGNGTQLLLIIQQLQDEVRSLRGELEQQRFQLKQMERQQLDRYRDLDRRISGLMTAPPAPVVATTSEEDDVSAPQANTAPENRPATVATAPAKPAPAPAPVTDKNGISDAKAYRDAFALVRERDFAGAITAFNAFVRDYPGSPRVANAHYWLGEIYHAEQKLEPAREAFALVLGQYPEHPKAPHAAYKLGVIYSELGDAKRSQEYLDYVLKKHPDSNVAPLAKDFKRN